MNSESHKFGDPVPARLKPPIHYLQTGWDIRFGTSGATNKSERLMTLPPPAPCPACGIDHMESVGFHEMLHAQLSPDPAKMKDGEWDWAVYAAEEFRINEAVFHQARFLTHGLTCPVTGEPGFFSVQDCYLMSSHAAHARAVIRKMTTLLAAAMTTPDGAAVRNAIRAMVKWVPTDPRFKTDMLKASQTALNYICQRLTETIGEGWHPHFLVDEDRPKDRPLATRHDVPIPGWKSVLNLAEFIRRLFDDYAPPLPPEASEGEGSSTGGETKAPSSDRKPDDLGGDRDEDHDPKRKRLPDAGPFADEGWFETWGKTDLVEPDLPRTLNRKPMMEHYHLDHGGEMRSPHRIIVDKMPFRLKKRGAGGTLLIDVSGSMSLSEDEIARMINAAPASTIALYEGMDYENGEVRVIAKNGHVANREYCRRKHGSNLVDGVALSWLTTMPLPRVWISDGCATRAPGDQLVSPHTIGQMQRLLVQGRINHVETIDEAIRLLKRRPKRHGFVPSEILEKVSKRNYRLSSKALMYSEKGPDPLATLKAKKT